MIFDFYVINLSTVGIVYMCSNETSVIKINNYYLNRYINEILYRNIDSQLIKEYSMHKT